MSTEKTFEEIRKIIEDADRLKQEAIKNAAAPLNKLLVKTVTDMGVAAIVWTQYTPYFNDGEVCEFTVNDPEIVVKILDEDVDFVDHDEHDETLTEVFCNDDFSGSYYMKCLQKGDKYYVRLKEMQDRHLATFPNLKKDVAEFLKWFQSSSTKDILENVYGDHVKIVVTKDGVRVLEYEHN